MSSDRSTLLTVCLMILVAAPVMFSCSTSRMLVSIDESALPASVRIAPVDIEDQSGLIGDTEEVKRLLALLLEKRFLIDPDADAVLSLTIRERRYLRNFSYRYSRSLFLNVRDQRSVSGNQRSENNNRSSGYSSSGEVKIDPVRIVLISESDSPLNERALLDLLVQMIERIDEAQRSLTTLQADQPETAEIP